MPVTDPKNRLLVSLGAEDLQAMIGDLQPVDLDVGETIYQPEDEVNWIYFPDRGLLSSVSVMLSGAMVETSVTGCEGGIGFLEATSSRIILSRVFVQLPVQGWRIAAADYRRAFDALPRLRELIGAHIELLLTEARQQIACHALHQAGQRLAWWLLECSDRSGRPEEMPLTQDFLADMLGCTRPTVSVIASELQAKGLISYSRGALRILDEQGLKRQACECYVTTERFRKIVETSTRSTLEP